MGSDFEGSTELTSMHGPVPLTNTRTTTYPMAMKWPASSS